MLAYDVALFLHLIGVIAMFSGFAVYQRAGTLLRAAQDGRIPIAAVGASVSGRHLHRIRALLGEGRGRLSRELTETIADPFPWTAA